MSRDSNNPPFDNVPTRRFRSAPKVWKQIISSIVTDCYDGKAITYEMIEDAAKTFNQSITRESLRVKFSRYKKAGYVRTAKDPLSPKRYQGGFWLTESGQIFFGLKERSERKKAAVLPTPPSKWSRKLQEIHQAAATAN